MSRPAFRLLLLGSSALMLLAAPADAQRTGSGQLSLNRLFGTRDFAPEVFGPARWLENGTAYTTLEDSDIKDAQDLVRYETATGARTILVSAKQLIVPGDSTPLEVEEYSWSPDGNMLLVFTNSQKVWRENTRGDFYLLDRTTGKLEKLGGPQAKPSTLMFAKFSPEGKRVAYVRENNLYVEDLATHAITQLTSDGSRTTINGTFDWVYEEELSLRDGFRWSPDGQRIAYWQLDAAGVRDFLLINNTDSLYSFVTPVQYPKTGTTNSAGRVGVVSATGGATRWIQVPGDPRNNYIARMDWAASPNELLIQHLNRPQNVDDLLMADATTGAVRTILSERDSAWLDVVDDVKWLDKGARFTWVSERDGWRHVYLVSRDGKTIKLITPGAFDVISVSSIDDAGGWLYYIASPDNPTQRYLFRTRLDGKGKPERLSPETQPGTHVYSISPDRSWAFEVFSNIDTPPTTSLLKLPTHAVTRVLQANTKLHENVAELQRNPTEFFKVNADGVQLDGWVVKPPTFDPNKKYPVLFYVYGEPASQTVVDEWDGFQTLWFTMLAQQGYVVISVDNRGTPSPRGRDFRKAIYRKVGILNSHDQAAAAAVITHWPYIDPARVAVWGWSGGGSMTLNLMFRSPEIYKVGMSVAPVSDEHFYDTIYQERYMGVPQENEEAYRLGSPINFADQLQGKLLLVHGSGDDNVHFQNSEALINKLITANKPFTFMDYPNRSHCICEGKGTSRHLFELLTRFLRENIAPGPGGV